MDVFVVTRNTSSWAEGNAGILLVTPDWKTAFDYDPHKELRGENRGDVKIDVWRNGEVYNSYLWADWDARWVEQVYPETKKSIERREADARK